MKTFNDFLATFDKDEFIKNYETLNSEYKEEASRNFGSHTFLAYEILRLYHNWLFENFDIKPKD